MEEKKYSLKPTIVIGIFVAIMLLIAILFIIFDAPKAIEEMKNNVEDAGKNSQAPVTTSVAVGFFMAFGILGVFLYFIFLAANLGIGSAILLIFTIKNIKIADKRIKITNIIYTILLSSFLIIISIKTVLLFALI